MKAYIGTKIIQAEPAKHPESGEDGYVVMYPDGYTSWSPKHTFEAAYREISFSERQLVELVDAKRVTHASDTMLSDDDLAAAIDLASDHSVEEEPEEAKEPEHKHDLGQYNPELDGRPCRTVGCDYLE